MYCLAVATERYGILIHSYTVQSNHYHLELTDVHGNLPEFMCWFNRHIAKSINSQLGRWENLFDNGKYSAVHLVDAAAVRDKMAYILANPVEAELVERAKDWPGCWSDPNSIDGAPITVERPKGFFRSDGPMPKTATLRLTRPPCFSDMTTKDFRKMVKADLAEREANVRKRMERARRTFLGVRAIRATSPFSSPHSREPRRNLNPRIASRNKRTRDEAIRERQVFLDAYRVALTAWRQGRRDAVFPAGTYWMRHHAGVRCADGDCARGPEEARPPPNI